MATKPYAKTISDTQVMVKGIRDNQKVLSQRKIDVKFADSVQTNIDLCVKLNGEQETLKAKLKTKTEELDAALTSLAKKTQEARKIIKLDMPQSTWLEFGIEDKR